MKKIASILVSALLLLNSCGSVPITGRNQLLLVSDSEVITSSLTQYSEYMKSAPISTDTKGKAMVTRVGKKIATGIFGADMNGNQAIADYYDGLSNFYGGEA